MRHCQIQSFDNLDTTLKNQIKICSTVAVHYIHILKVHMSP
jgi:hypothetical protein